MTYLDFERLDACDAGAFQAQEPFPWQNFQGALTAEGYQRLLSSFPDVSMFKRSFGKKRRYGQQSHDRFALEYHPHLDIPGPWKEFIGELGGERYRAFVRRMFGVEDFDMNFHWHYAPRGCAVSPHCDAPRKVGSHLFYLNPPEDRDQAWGGQTLVLFDKGRFHCNSAPGFEDFDERQTVVAETMNNHSFLFQRTPHSWHGVREITCPEGSMRKVFITVINFPPSLLMRLRRLVGNLPEPY